MLNFIKIKRDGEGCFYVNIVKSVTGYKLWLLFQITQHSGDRELMQNIATYFQCGTIRHRTLKISAVDYVVTKFELLRDITVPFLLKNPLYSSKAKDFSLFQNFFFVF